MKKQKTPQQSKKLHPKIHLSRQNREKLNAPYLCPPNRSTLMGFYRRTSTNNGDTWKRETEPKHLVVDMQDIMEMIEQKDYKVKVKVANISYMVVSFIIITS